MQIDGYEAFTFDALGKPRTVFTRGDGPAVVVMHEIPGIAPEVLRFTTRVANEGFRVFLPQMFGTPGRESSIAYEASQVLRACISREFHMLASNGSSPIVDSLRWSGRARSHQANGTGIPRP